jgi:NUMOD3 motif.
MGGEGARNPSEETRAKISKSGKGRKLSDEHKQKLLEANRGRECPKEVREKISRSNLGKKNSKDAREKISAANKGRKLSKKVREGRSGKGSSRYTPRDWYHPVHGKILQRSLSELIEMFPGENLHSGCLSQVALGKQSHHKKWTRVESFTGDK